VEAGWDGDGAGRIADNAQAEIVPRTERVHQPDDKAAADNRYKPFVFYPPVAVILNAVLYFSKSKAGQPEEDAGEDDLPE